MDKKRVKMNSHVNVGAKSSYMSENIENTTSESDEEVVHVATFKADTRPNVQHVLATSLKIPVQDLAVHKKKVEAVEEWLTDAFAKKNSGLLLLTGPTGSGKTATLQAIAAANKVHVMEWTTPMDDFYDNNGGYSNQTWTSQSDRFEDFIIGGSRYNPVVGPAIAKKLILVEDFPNTFLVNPAPFHEIIRKYGWMGRCPLVFITTQVNTGTKISRDLFPEKLLMDLKVKEISFNAIAASFMAKAIDRLALLQNREDVAQDVRESICQAANGDIRNAVQMWAFHTQVPLSSLENKPHRNIAPPKKKTRKRKSDKGSGSGPSVPLLDCKDAASGMLPSIGRVLYAKRDTVPTVGGSCDSDDRGFLKTNPQDIIDQFTPDHRCFVGMCHENYLTIFSDLKSISLASEQLSMADIMLGASRDSDVLKEIGFSVAVRGVMNACHKPINQWNPLRKDKWTEISQQAAKHLQRVREIYATSTLCSTQDMVMDVIPCVKSLRSQPYVGLGCSRLDEDMPQSPIPHITDSDSDLADAD